MLSSGQKLLRLISLPRIFTYFYKNGIMRQFTRKEIQNVMRNKDYKFFYRGTYNLNIIAVRSENSESDKFDDHLYVLYRDENGIKHSLKFDCTTDPGKHWLLNPLNVKGTIILVPGQYRSVYTLGLHNRSRPNKSYEALEQIKPMLYYRDNDRNSTLNLKDIFNKEKHEFSIAKTNIHRASRWKILPTIGKYSAGCQVIQKPNDFDTFIELCKKQISYGNGNKFTYTLLDEKDF